MQPFSIHPDTQPGHVALTVADLAQALDFYAGVLGLGVLRQDEDVWLGAAEAAPLVALTPRAGARPRPLGTTGLYHLAILLPSRGALARALRQLIAQRYPLQGMSDHGVSEAIYLSDPEGNGIEIYADRPREVWPWENGRLQMVTAPLDVEDLSSESRENQDRDRALAGARIGHVHLHVGDLAEAQRFYCDVLGFDLIQRYGSSALFVSAGGYHHHVGINTWAGVGAPPPPEDAVGLRYYTLLLPDQVEVARMAERLDAAGVAFEQPARGGLALRDPSANGILITAGETSHG